MEDIIGSLVNNIEYFVQNSNFFISISIGILIIALESIIPMLPLSVFIAINIIAFGNIIGFIISFVATMIGCTISFYIFRRIRPWLFKKLNKRPKLIKFINKIDKLSFSKLVLVLALPFTPAFSINIAAGLSEMKYKKFFFSLIISKMFIVYFWGFVATTLLESMTDINVIIKLAVIIISAFVLSKMAMKKFKF